VGKYLNSLWVIGNLNILENPTTPHYTSLYILHTKIEIHTRKLELHFILNVTMTKITYIIPTTLYVTHNYDINSTITSSMGKITSLCTLFL
jgi:hypothetical protein